jgi:inorganic triphosphatase YgiF
MRIANEFFSSDPIYRTPATGSAVLSARFVQTHDHQNAFSHDRGFQTTNRLGSIASSIDKAGSVAAGSVMNGDPREIELKLLVDPEDMATLKNHPSFSCTLHDPTHEKLNSVYFDSNDRTLRDHGLTLRVRHIGDKRFQTIKAASLGSYSIERSEWEQLVEGDQPELAGAMDTALGPLLTKGVRSNLKPVFETRIDRTTYRLNGDNTAIALSIDEGQIIAPGGSWPISEIEFELKHGNPIELFKIARVISEIVPAKLDVKSKSERGYEFIEEAQIAAEKARDPELSANMSAGRAFTLICRACLRHLIANEPATIRRNAEALHQMRIAIRRLRAAISLFSDIARDDRMEAIKAELRGFARELGPARDLDVFLTEVLNPLKKQHKGEPGLVSISKKFARQRLQGYRRAHDAVQSARFRALVLDTAEWVEAGPWSRSEDPVMRKLRDMPIAIYAAQQLSRRRKKIRRRGAGMGELDPEQLHRLRIQVKKARYAAEFFSSVYEGKKAAKRRKRIVSSLRRLQNSLGGLNDIVTRKKLCADLIANPDRGLTAQQSRRRAYAAGLVMGQQQAQFQGLFDVARKSYLRFDDAKIFWKMSQRRSASPHQHSITSQL